MNHHLQEQRRAANEAFLESLDQMALCFQTDAKEPIQAEPPPAAVPNNSADLDIAALEAAIADIEQLMQHQS